MFGNLHTIDSLHQRMRTFGMDNVKSDATILSGYGFHSRYVQLGIIIGINCNFNLIGDNVNMVTSVQIEHEKVSWRHFVRNRWCFAPVASIVVIVFFVGKMWEFWNYLTALKIRVSLNSRVYSPSRIFLFKWISKKFQNPQKYQKIVIGWSPLHRNASKTAHTYIFI
jgi:hypothetical protein